MVKASTQTTTATVQHALQNANANMDIKEIDYEWLIKQLEQGIDELYSEDMVIIYLDTIVQEKYPDLDYNKQEMLEIIKSLRPDLDQQLNMNLYG